MEFEFLIDKKPQKITIESEKDSCIADLLGKKLKIDYHFISPNTLSILVEGKSYLIHLAQDKEKMYLSVNGEEFIIEEKKEQGVEEIIGESESAQIENKVTAPMPGKVIKINVSEGEKVEKDQTLAIVEAMKMENELKSPVKGIVKKILVNPNDLVDAFQPIIELDISD